MWLLNRSRSAPPASVAAPTPSEPEAEHKDTPKMLVLEGEFNTPKAAAREDSPGTLAAEVAFKRFVAAAVCEANFRSPLVRSDLAAGAQQTAVGLLSLGSGGTPGGPDPLSDNDLEVAGWVRGALPAGSEQRFVADVRARPGRERALRAAARWKRGPDNLAAGLAASDLRDALYDALFGHRVGVREDAAWQATFACSGGRVAPMNEKVLPYLVHLLGVLAHNQALLAGHHAPGARAFTSFLADRLLCALVAPPASHPPGGLVLCPQRSQGLVLGGRQLFSCGSPPPALRAALCAARYLEARDRDTLGLFLGLAAPPPASSDPQLLPRVPFLRVPCSGLFARAGGLRPPVRAVCQNFLAAWAEQDVRDAASARFFFSQNRPAGPVGGALLDRWLAAGVFDDPGGQFAEAKGARAAALLRETVRWLLLELPEQGPPGPVGRAGLEDQRRRILEYLEFDALRHLCSSASPAGLAADRARLGEHPVVARAYHTAVRGSGLLPTRKGAPAAGCRYWEWAASHLPRAVANTPSDSLLPGPWHGVGFLRVASSAKTRLTEPSKNTLLAYGLFLGLWDCQFPDAGSGVRFDADAGTTGFLFCAAAALHFLLGSAAYEPGGAGGAGPQFVCRDDLRVTAERGGPLEQQLRDLGWQQLAAPPECDEERFAAYRPSVDVVGPTGLLLQGLEVRGVSHVQKSGLHRSRARSRAARTEEVGRDGVLQLGAGARGPGQARRRAQGSAGRAQGGQDSKQAAASRAALAVPPSGGPVADAHEHQARVLHHSGTGEPRRPRELLLEVENVRPLAELEVDGVVQGPHSPGPELRVGRAHRSQVPGLQSRPEMLAALAAGQDERTQV